MINWSALQILNMLALLLLLSGVIIAARNYQIDSEDPNHVIKQNKLVPLGGILAIMGAILIITIVIYDGTYCS